MTVLSLLTSKLVAWSYCDKSLLCKGDCHAESHASHAVDPITTEPVALVVDTRLFPAWDTAVSPGGGLERRLRVLHDVQRRMLASK